ncbi:MAG: DUF4255 domain-containing protein [Nostoc sp.]|uniref:DUF4255 domain-containing protein n=1 Tax=Nostoc sp. TaxID=1180 RepID=UPI0030235B13
MPLGLLDLSIVTDRLISLLNASVQSSQLWSEETTPPDGTPTGINPGQRFDINVTGLPPDEIRSLTGCQLNLYLFHVVQDSFQRNSPVTGPWTTPPVTDPTKTTTRVPPIPYQPLSLDLYYLLTAYAKGSYIQEQQAMSIALKCFHENPIVRSTVPIDNRVEEFCLTMEVESVLEAGRLWQAITSSLRLSLIYKVSVIFIEPKLPPPLAKQVQTVNLAVSPASLPFAAAGQVIGTYIKVNYIGPNNTPSQPDHRSYDLLPAVVAPGQSFLLYGAGLNQNSSNRLYLLLPDGTEQDVTAWATPTNPPSPAAPVQTDSRFTLVLPTTGAPVAGVYQLRVGNNLPSGDPNAIRSNATPFSVAAWVDPTGGPLLSPVGGTYTINGIGFSPGTVEVLLETIALTPGQFTFTSSNAISFQLPGNLPNGRYGVRVRVNQVESPPAKWVVKTS